MYLVAQASRLRLGKLRNVHLSGRPPIHIPYPKFCSTGITPIIGGHRPPYKIPSPFPVIGRAVPAFLASVPHDSLNLPPQVSLRQ